MRDKPGKTPKDIALDKAFKLRDKMSGAGEFTQADYRQKLRDAMEPHRQAFQNDAWDGFVENLAATVDKSRTKDDGRQTMLPGMFDLEGEYRLGGGRRQAKRTAMLSHAMEVMANDDRNMAAVLQASARKRDELSRLTPYWGPGVTKQQAVDAYRSDNPDEEADSESA